MDFMNLLESLFRWIHVVAGVFWIGHLYFFNFVNAHFEGTLDGESKKKVVPELRPRALYWFRWGAAFTWVTGFLLLGMVYYMTGVLFEGDRGWGVGALLMIVLTFGGVFIYDQLVKTVLKDPQVLFWAGAAISLVFLFLGQYVGGFSVRGYAIHLGALFGSIMAFNVWFRIWPAQQQIITAIKGGQAPNADLVALAGGRSRHNTYMSVPLVFLMMSQHSLGWATNPIALSIIVLVGWAIVYHLYDRSKAVKGF